MILSLLGRALRGVGARAQLKHSLLLLDLLLIEVLVVVIPVERLLEDLLVEQLHVLLDLLAVLIPPLAVRVRGVKGVRIGWYEWRLDPLVQQVVPREVAQPGVVFDVLRAIETESVQRLALDQTIDEIGGLDGPAGRYVGFADLNLTGQDVLSDLAPVATGVRSAAKHALESNNAHGEVVNSHSVRLTAHNLRRHVAWRTGRVLLVFRVPNTRDAQVCNLEVAIRIEHQIFRFNVSVQDALLVKVFKGHEHACDEEACLLFGELLARGQVVA